MGQADFCKELLPGPAEASAGKSLDAPAQGFRLETHGIETFQSLHQAGDRLLRKEEPCGAVLEDLGGAAFAECNDGAAAREGLDRDQTEIFQTRENESSRSSVELPDSLIALPAQELDAEDVNNFETLL